MNDCERASPIVYISCVAEVRYSFVSHLLDALSRKGINDVFVDSDDVLSEEAQGKVERSKICVIVLPGNRTVSLEKLVKVLECQRNNDQVVVPVLHGDGPLQGEWLRELELRGLSPVHRKECSDSKLVEEIVRDVNEKLFYMGRIGIYSKVVEVENMINKQPLGIRCVGIWGMPGIGKATLAKAVVDQMSGGFDAHCFIEDYDTSIHENRVYRILVEQLMKDDPGNGGTITKMSLRRDKLNNKRVLVVLDDVCDPLLAESFLEGFDWFGPQSLIIITSRDKQVFRLCRINQIYEVQGLNEKEARQLFLLSASMSEENLHELSMKVIKYSNGNPLAISIYGKELKGKRPSEMETAFLQIKGYPPSKIVDAIKSSYGTLSDSEKNIFLDIACFFQGDNVDYVMQLLEGCGFFPHVGIDVLVEKCLVTISENRVEMHNLIQDVGRGIINAETVEIKGHSRLWEPWSVKYLSEDNYYKANGEPETTFKRAQGVEEIECMFLDASNLSFDVKPAAFDNMLNLRLLKIYCSNTEVHHEINFSEGVLHSLPNELRLLHWENYPLQYLPQKFDPRNLVEINMPYSQLRKLWGGTINLEMLRTIKLCHSQQLVNIDDLLKAQNLEVIDLQGCTSLKSFPATGQLLHLRVVNLSGCSKIKIFPEIPPNIETLHLQGTGIRKLPISPNGEQLGSLSEFKGLSHALILKHLTSLDKCSSSSQDLGRLICLELKDCSRLRSLPNMAHLEFLNVFDLSGCSKLKTIRGFPPNLKELYLVGTAVREVPQLPQSLELLNAHGSRLQSLPDMANLKFLKVLDLSCCSKLKIIQGFPRNLKELYLAGTGLREVPQLPLCLELLNAHGCVSQKSIHLDSEKPPMHYTFSNFFDLSPHIVNDFFVKALTNDLNKAPTFSFSAPSHTNQNATLDLQPGSSVMTRLNPSWRNTLVGFAMLVEVSFSDDYSDVTGLGIRCVCRWKNEEGHSQRIERYLHCWATGEAVPNVQKDHTPSLKNTSPVLSLDPMEVSGNEVEEVSRVSYDGLPAMEKALFLYIACLFNDEDVDLVAPLIASVGLAFGSEINNLADQSLIHVSSSGQIVMHCLLRKMGKEILHRKSMLPGSSKDLTRDNEKVFVASSLSHVRRYDVFLSFSGQDVCKTFLSHLVRRFDSEGITTFSDAEIMRELVIGQEIKQAIRESRILIVVFSKNFVSSSWNLQELVEIATCGKTSGQIVIPIFYKVDPSDVRKQTGKFGRLFEETCKNKTVDEKQRWRKALTDIANIIGFINEHWGNEADMIEALAAAVSERLRIARLVLRNKTTLEASPITNKHPHHTNVRSSDVIETAAANMKPELRPIRAVPACNAAKLPDDGNKYRAIVVGKRAHPVLAK
ncbi:unnamed protein product [Arabidopsis lyrata]|nr:unnamed protein product [Arabidopsis lyrata]